MNKTAVALISLVAGAMGGCGVGCSYGSYTASHHDTAGSSSSAVTSIAGTPSRTTPIPILTAADFEIGIIVTEKDCIGSAGCVVRYDLDPRFVGTSHPPVGAMYTVIFDVDGGKQPRTGNLRYVGGSFDWDRQAAIEVPVGAILTATPTQVR